MDFASVCRTCLGSKSLNPIFKNEAHHDRFSTAMINTTGLKIGLNDGLPQNICIDCMVQVNQSLKFRSRCKDAETKLLQIINDDNVAVYYTEYTLNTDFENDDLKDEDNIFNKLNMDGEDNSEEILKSDKKNSEVDLKIESLNTNVIEIDQGFYYSSEDEKPLKYLIDETENVENNKNMFIDKLKSQNKISNLNEASPKTIRKKTKSKNKKNSGAHNNLKKDFTADVFNTNIDTHQLNQTEINVENVNKTKQELLKDTNINHNTEAKEVHRKLSNKILTTEKIEATNKTAMLINKPYTNEQTDKANKTLEATKTNVVNIDSPNEESSDVNNTVKLVLNKKTDRVACKICMKSLSSRSVTYHMNKSHPGVDERKAKCELCETYVLKERLKQHYTAMHGRDRSICKYCKLEFSSKDILMVHVATCTKKKRKRSAYFDKGRIMSECDLCHKKMQRASLKVHLKIKHAGLGPVCDHCGRKFGNKFRLNEHLRSKHGYDKFKCSECDFQSAGIMAMKNHQRWHRGEKPYVCEQCGANFHASYLLTQHKQSHRTEKLLKCDLCPASFKSNNSLHVHKAACHSGARYKCTLCARAYNCRHYVVKHLRTMHRYTGPVPRLDRKLDN